MGLAALFGGVRGGVVLGRWHPQSRIASAKIMIVPRPPRDGAYEATQHLVGLHGNSRNRIERSSLAYDFPGMVPLRDSEHFGEL